MVSFSLGSTGFTPAASNSTKSYSTGLTPAASNQGIFTPASVGKTVASKPVVTKPAKTVKPKPTASNQGIFVPAKPVTTKPASSKNVTLKATKQEPVKITKKADPKPVKANLNPTTPSNDPKTNVPSNKSPVGPAVVNTSSGPYINTSLHPYYENGKVVYK